MKEILKIGIAAVLGGAATGLIVKAGFTKQVREIALAEAKAYAPGVVDDAIEEALDERSTKELVRRLNQKINDYDPERTAKHVFQDYANHNAEDYIRKEAHPVIRAAVQGKLKTDLEERLDQFDYTATIRKAVREQVGDYIKNNADSIIKSEVKTYVHDRVDSIGDTIKTVKTLKDIVQ